VPVLLEVGGEIAGRCVEDRRCVEDEGHGAGPSVGIGTVPIRPTTDVGAAVASMSD